MRKRNRDIETENKRKQSLSRRGAATEHSGPKFYVKHWHIIRAPIRQENDDAQGGVLENDGV